MTAPDARPMTDPTDETLRLSVVIPTHNAEPRIAETLETVMAYLARKPFAAEVIVVDDGSTDPTADLARAALAGRIRSQVLRRDRNLGKGASVQEGVLAALEAGADIVIGSRAHPDSEIRVRQRRPREWLGKAFNVLVRLFVLKGFRDTQCGFKAFRAAAAKDIFSRLRTPGFGFDVEVLVLCRELGYRVVEIPVVWCNARPSRLKIFKGSWGMLKDLWRIGRQARRDARRRARA